MIRLINTSSLHLEAFEGEDVPPYAVLSHRWGTRQDEVSFKDYQKGLKKESSGYNKIVTFCDRAMALGLEWVWIDTCCIDKRSSAELSEAINSMFAWYQRADVCFAYLQDVKRPDKWQKSSWWHRGWTLQELIAPRKMIFCDRHWRDIGHREDMAEDIHKSTGIPVPVLSMPGMYKHFSVAQKMSWAANRVTTRIEDRAYSLLGLFHINMPLLYGEGKKAFQRLQVEVLQKYSDESLFAWSAITAGEHLVLADSPDRFEHCLHMEPLPSGGDKELPIERPKHQRALHPPRATSWGIELCANARKLVPLQEQPVHVDGKPQAFLWAITLTTAWNGRFRELPCTIILVRSGPAPYSYKRFDCLFGSTSSCFAQLCERYDVCDLEEDVMFYLQFDADFDV